jgi:5-amino-6-(5-phosphoribosylamino)uracil reductase
MKSQLPTPLQTIVILAMTADGKIADYQHGAARFGSVHDQHHLEQQISLADGVLFGAGTLRAYGTTMSVSDPLLLQDRKKRLGSADALCEAVYHKGTTSFRARSQPLQPIQIVVSASGDLDPQMRFFQQPIPRWLITLPGNDVKWQNKPEFERIILAPVREREHNSLINWTATFQQLADAGIQKLAILGGGELVAALFDEDLIDELWLTLCPVIFGGKSAPTPVGGRGFIQSQGKKLQLLEVRQIEQELFLHYLVNSEQ